MNLTTPHAVPLLFTSTQKLRSLGLRKGKSTKTTWIFLHQVLHTSYLTCYLWQFAWSIGFTVLALSLIFSFITLHQHFINCYCLISLILRIIAKTNLKIHLTPTYPQSRIRIFCTQCFISFLSSSIATSLHPSSMESALPLFSLGFPFPVRVTSVGLNLSWSYFSNLIYNCKQNEYLIIDSPTQCAPLSLQLSHVSTAF